MAGRWRHLAWNFSRKFFFLSWMNSFGLLLFFLPKSRLFPSLFQVFLAGNGRPLIFSSKKNFFPSLLGVTWESLGRPLDLCSSLYLVHERRRLPSVKWGPKAAGCGYGTPWTGSVAGSVVSTCQVMGENVTSPVETLVHYRVNMTQQNKMQVMQTQAKLS